MSKIDIIDPTLWGNEAADDEDPRTLDTYFVDQPIFAPFFSDSVRLSIARARKGLGKSALLRLGAYRRRQSHSSPIVIEMKGADLAALRPVKTLSPDEYIYDWQQRLCMAINRELANQIGFALDDDSVTVVETAELVGWKSRNLLGALLDRLSGKIGSVQTSKIEAKDHQSLFGRLQKKYVWNVWIFVDDIDATFRQSPEESLRLSTFFSACRAIVSNFSGVHIRTCVRTDVWTSIRRSDEALDKCEQYIFDIKWSQKQTGSILNERVASYLQRQHPHRVMPYGDVLDRVIEPFFRWGNGSRPSHAVIHTYSAGRPRWAAQLCRMAAGEAIAVRDVTIKGGHVGKVMTDYGRYRLDDIVREHKHQCAELGAVVNVFANQHYSFGTQRLLEFVRTKVVERFDIAIEADPASSSLVVSRFLFRVGFIVACDLKTSERHASFYYSCDERPDLLTNYANLDSGCVWHIHPAFQAVLGIK